jgi:hypothetical protein
VAAEPELLQLANLAAEGLLTAMMSDGWSTVKRRFATVLTFGDRNKSLAEAHLDNSYAAISAAPNDDDLRAGIAREWQEQFRALIEEYPATADPLRQLVSDIPGLTVGIERSQVKNVKQRAKARDRGTVFQQGSGNQISINYGEEKD